MQEDFHYYCIAVLARAAGFSPPEALVVAYASQYTDDATENLPVTLVDPGSGLTLKFDPVRTQYTGLKANNWTVQKQVYMPFHFLPPLPLQYPYLESYLDFVPDHAFDFVTRPDSPFARWLLRSAAADSNPRRRLCRIGIALHTYADTWAHQAFSGRESAAENALEDPDYFDGQWHREGLTDYLIERITALVAKDTGHANAGYLPDLSFLHWRYKNAQGELVERNNAELFLTAARTIYEQLRQLNVAPAVSPLPWQAIEGGIWHCLTYRGSLGDDLSTWDLYGRLTEALAERCAEWQRTFPHLFDQPERYRYDRLLWRRIALAPRLVDDSYFGPGASEGRAEGSEEWAQWGRASGYLRERGDGWTWEEWAECYDWDREFKYDERNLEWDDWSRTKRFERLQFPLKPNFPDSWWVHFHRAALRQRHLVLEGLP